MQTAIPTIAPKWKPRKDIKFDWRVGDLIVVPVKDRCVLAVLVEKGPRCIAAWGDFQVIVPPAAGRFVRRSQVSDGVGKLVGMSFASIQEAREVLRPYCMED